MKHYNLIIDIIRLLEQGDQTVKSLLEKLKQPAKSHQIRKAIGIIKKMHVDRFFEETGRSNTKRWRLESQTTVYEYNTQRLLRGVLPRVFSIKRQDIVENLVGKLDSAMDSTHFYETEAHRKLDENLETILFAIDRCNKIRINEISGDSTSLGTSIIFPVIVLPISIRYHRGCFYLVSVENTGTNTSVWTFQIDQLSIAPTDESFQKAEYIALIDSALKYRFGISQNINGEVYDIRLRFSSITGTFIKDQFWHDEMNLPIQDGDGWIVEFRCGINRELVGWLFQWMSNVKVLGPPELITLYNQQLDAMQKIRYQDAAAQLEYTNIFAP